MKKGFTLLELLAVIVVLAIIALIVTPFVTNAINEARIGSAENSTYGIISAAELYYAETLAKNGGVFDPLTLTFSNGIMSPNAFTFKGDKPKSGTITIDENGVVEVTSLTFNNNECSGGNKKEVVCNQSGKTPDPIVYQEYKTGTKDEVNVIYFNPVTNKECSAGESECMKWYVIENSGSNKSTVDVILDHNTVSNVNWASAKEQVITTTSGWHTNVKNTVRLIKANEVADIVKARGTGSTKVEKFDSNISTSDKWFYFDGYYGTDASWHTQIINSRGESKYSWLFDNTKECTSFGCDIADTNIDNWGYWTQDTVFEKSSSTWYVNCTGALHELNAGYSYYGIRPVITIQKSVLSGAKSNVDYKTGTNDVVSVIYYNPNTNTKCEESQVIETGKEGCMRWYTIKNSYSTESTVDVILDHNTTLTVSSFNIASVTLTSDASKWHVDVKNTVRPITTDEVAKITGADKALGWKGYSTATAKYRFYLDGAYGTDVKWQTQIASSTNKSKYVWLFDNIYDCEKNGCNKQISQKSYGYWLGELTYGDSDYAWRISLLGRLDYAKWDFDGNGIRPVITISKTVLQ